MWVLRTFEGKRKTRIFPLKAQYMELVPKIPLTLEERLEYGDTMRLPASWEEFLDAVEKSEYRMEYDEGQIISFMGYGSIEHEAIVGNIIRLLGNLFLAEDYRIFGSNLALHIPEYGPRYYNADCVVVKGEPERTVLRAFMTAVANPVLLVEVLSESSYDFDFGKKFTQYKKIPSLQQFLCIDSQEMQVFSYNRYNGGNDWLLRDFSQPGDAVPILEEGSLTLEEIYRTIKLQER